MRSLHRLPHAGAYGVLYADPPWAFRTFAGDNCTPHRSAEDHYLTMPREQLRTLPVADIAGRRSALFMWTVSSHLDEAMHLGAAWGFEWKTIVFVWVKPSIGFGYWTRKQTELCLLFTRGKPRRKSRGVPELIMAPRREHSRKPDEVYGRIEALVDGPYLELFARTTWPGWDAWGNQVGKFAKVDPGEAA